MISAKNVGISAKISIFLNPLWEIWALVLCYLCALRISLSFRQARLAAECWMMHIRLAESEVCGLKCFWKIVYGLQVLELLTLSRLIRIYHSRNVWHSLKAFFLVSSPMRTQKALALRGRQRRKTCKHTVIGRLRVYSFMRNVQNPIIKFTIRNYLVRKKILQPGFTERNKFLVFSQFFFFQMLLQLLLMNFSILRLFR